MVLVVHRGLNKMTKKEKREKEMAAYHTVNKKAQIFARPRRIITMMDMRRTEKVDVEEVHSRMPTTKLDKTELDRLLNICK